MVSPRDSKYTITRWWMLQLILLMVTARPTHSVELISNNVAVGKPSSMSSLYIGGHADQNHAAYLANDGAAADCQTPGFRFATTGRTEMGSPEMEPWWCVNLEDSMLVELIVLYRRYDPDSKRLQRWKDLAVGVGLVQPSGVLDPTSYFTCYSFTTAPTAEETRLEIECDDDNEPVRGQFVILQIVGRAEYLSVCEVEVYIVQRNITLVSNLYNWNEASEVDALPLRDGDNTTCITATPFMRLQHPWWSHMTAMTLNFATIRPIAVQLTLQPLTCQGYELYNNYKKKEKEGCVSDNQQGFSRCSVLEESPCTFHCSCVQQCSTLFLMKQQPLKKFQGQSYEHSVCEVKIVL